MTDTITKIDTQNSDQIAEYYGIEYFSDFKSADEVREYFTPENIADMFGDSDETTEELNEMAETIIKEIE